MKRIAIVALFLAAGGCAPKPEAGPEAPAQTPARSTKPAHGGPAAPGAPGAPASPMGADPHAGAAAAPNAPEEPQDEKVAQAQAAYDKDKSDANKKALVTALVSNADYYMYNAPLPPREKYTKALSLYRRAAKLDPQNETAKQSIQTIEDIYRSMGRPVPEDTGA